MVQKLESKWGTNFRSFSAVLALVFVSKSEFVEIYNFWLRLLENYWFFKLLFFLLKCWFRSGAEVCTFAEVEKMLRPFFLFLEQIEWTPDGDKVFFSPKNDHEWNNLSPTKNDHACCAARPDMQSEAEIAEVGSCARNSRDLAYEIEPFSSYSSYSCTSWLRRGVLVH